DSSKKLSHLIEQEYNYRIKHLHNTFSPINASSAEALLLRINPDDAIYFVRMKMVDTNDQIIGYVSNYFPGEFTEFEVMVHAV
ncbi:MAG: UTRA domain-containing protein, partial [Candidatus Delongbacteria bacterium]|nr:UTRA domain-containing protein [Candidatus Delongbacteria bacterium]